MGCFFSGCSTHPDENNLPILSLSFDPTVDQLHKHPVTLVDSSSAFLKELQGTLKRRGGRSMAYPKHSYRLDLVKHLAIGNLPADDDWILNANYIDKTFLRHALSYQLFRDMDSANWAPQCRYVHLYLNSHYNGLYVLMEKPDKSSMQVHPGGFIFKEPQIFRESYSGLQVQDSLNFHQQKFPKLHEQNFTPTLEAFRTFIRTATPSEFQNEIAQWVDLRNIIDWHLLLLITNNGDGVVKNFYWYALDKNSPMRVAPWDYDHSFGRDGDNELNMDTRPLTIERNILLKRLLTWSSYRRMLSERWHQLNTQKVLSISGLQSRIMEEGARIRSAALRNFEVWPVNGPYYYDANTFDEELQIMHDFIPIRHQRISDYFDSLTDP